MYKICFQHSVVSQKKKEVPCPEKAPSLEVPKANKHPSAKSNHCGKCALWKIIYRMQFVTLGNVATKADRFCAGRKTVPDNASLFTHKNGNAISVTQRKPRRPL